MSEESTNSESTAVQYIHSTLSPFTPSQRARILGAIFSLMDISRIEPPENSQLLTAERKGIAEPQQTIDTFVRGKKPGHVPQRLACLAYYLEKYGEFTSVTAKDLRKANDDARQETIDDVSRDLSSAARRDKFFRKTKGHGYQLTPLGMDVVEALPDQARVKTIIGEQSRVVRGGTRKKIKGR